MIAKKKIQNFLAILFDQLLGRLQNRLYRHNCMSREYLYSQHFHRIRFHRDIHRYHTEIGVFVYLDLKKKSKIRLDFFLTYQRPPNFLRSSKENFLLIIYKGRNRYFQFWGFHWNDLARRSLIQFSVYKIYESVFSSNFAKFLRLTLRNPVLHSSRSKNKFSDNNLFHSCDASRISRR